MKRAHISAGTVAPLLLLLAACSRSSTAPDYGTPTLQPASVAVVVHNTLAVPTAVTVELAGEAALKSAVEAGADRVFNIAARALEGGNPVRLLVISTAGGCSRACTPLWVRAGYTVDVSVTEDGVAAGQRSDGGTRPGNRPVS